MTTAPSIQPRMRKRRRSYCGTRIAGQPNRRSHTLRGRASERCRLRNHETAAPGVRGWTQLPGRERAALRRGFERVVISVGTLLDLGRHPAHPHAIRRRVEDTPRERDHDEVSEQGLEILRAPLAVARADRG